MPWSEAARRLVRASRRAAPSACGLRVRPAPGRAATPSRWRGHENVRLPFRCIHVTCVGQLANAWSLLNQYHLVGDASAPDNGHRQRADPREIRASASGAFNFARRPQNCFIRRHALRARRRRGRLQFCEGGPPHPAQRVVAEPPILTRGSEARRVARGGSSRPRVRAEQEMKNMRTTTRRGQGGLHRAERCVGFARSTWN